MPSTFAHYYFGHKVLNKLDDGTRRIILGNKKVFDVGLHGPDIFFFYRPFYSNKVIRMGFRMHRENVNEFLERSKIVFSHINDKKAAIAYLTGFVCHFVLDSKCHGFIDEWKEHIDVAHTEIETEFDKYLLRSFGKNPLQYKFGKHLSVHTNEISVIDSFYPLKPGTTRKAVWYMKHILAILSVTNKKFQKKEKDFLRMIGCGDFVMGMILKTSDNPKCRKSNKVLAYKLNDAVDTAVRLVQNYVEYLYNESELDDYFQRNFK